MFGVCFGDFMRVCPVKVKNIKRHNIYLAQKNANLHNYLTYKSTFSNNLSENTSYLNF